MIRFKVFIIILIDVLDFCIQIIMMTKSTVLWIKHLVGPVVIVQKCLIFR